MGTNKTLRKIIDTKHKISEDRSLVLHVSTQVETYINIILQTALGLSGKETISFGDTSKALPFINKIRLFMDYGVLKKEQQNRFIKLMEIRNQFAHNSKIKNFEDLAVNQNGKDALIFLEKSFASEIHDYVRNNDNLIMLFLALTKEIESIIIHILNTMGENATKHGTTKAKLMKHDVFQELLIDQTYLRTLSNESKKALELFLKEANRRIKLLIEIEIKNKPDHIFGVPLI